LTSRISAVDVVGIGVMVGGGGEGAASHNQSEGGNAGRWMEGIFVQIII